MATANKGTLLYGNMEGGSTDSSASAQFIEKLLVAVDTIHKAHLMVSGPGSFAAHEALGETYSALEDGLDALAESYMGCYGVGLEFKGVDVSSYSAEVRKIYDYMEANRAMMGTESHIQNKVDEIIDGLARSLFKLDRLA
jgi:DNA-binding ferritin-like protein